MWMIVFSIVYFVLKADQLPPSQNVININMGMQINSAQIASVSEQSRKPELPNHQATQKGMSARPQAEQPLGSTFPAEGNPQARLPWDGSGRVEPTVSVGPPLGITYPSATSPSQGALLNRSGMISPGGVPPLPTRSIFLRDAGVPFGQYGFPPPPPHVMDPMGMPGPFPEV